jgi:hypothetical protein
VSAAPRLAKCVAFMVAAHRVRVMLADWLAIVRQVTA